MGAKDSQQVLRLLAFFCVGYAASRACSEIPAGVGMPGFSYLSLEIGKLMGIALTILFGYCMRRTCLSQSRTMQANDVRQVRDASRGETPLVLVIGTLTVISCLATIVLFSLGAAGMSSGTVVAIGGIISFAIGAGTAGSMILWLERCALMPSRLIVMGISSAYILDSFIVLVAHALIDMYISSQFYLFVGLLMLALATLSLGAFIVCDSERGVLDILDAHPRSIPERAVDAVPIDVILWTVVIGSTFSLMEHGGSDLLLGTWADSVGRLVLCAIILTACILWVDRFDMRLLLGMTLPLVITALALMTYQNAGSTFGQILFSMGAAAARILVYLIVCLRAYQLGISALYGCGGVMFLNVATHLLSTLALGRMDPSALQPIPAIIIAIFLDATVIVILLIHEVDHLARLDEMPGIRPHSSPMASMGTSDASEQVQTGADPHSRILELAESHALSPRETTVFLYMADGKSNAEIGDILFLSRGAVRSHASRIYDKFGIHTRAELDIVIDAAKSVS